MVRKAQHSRCNRSFLMRERLHVINDRMVMSSPQKPLFPELTARRKLSNSDLVALSLARDMVVRGEQRMIGLKAVAEELQMSISTAGRALANSSGDVPRALVPQTFRRIPARTEDDRTC
jgi:hypothetical protein